MTLNDFQILVLQNAEWFRGVHPETADSIAQVERKLEVVLPNSLKWLLMQWGYSTVCGVDSLDEAVETTLRVRTVLGLPILYVILNDWQDAGIVFFDTAVANADGEYPVYWTAECNLHRLATSEAMDGDVDSFPGYAEWVSSRLDAERMSSDRGRQAGSSQN